MNEITQTEVKHCPHCGSTDVFGIWGTETTASLDCNDCSESFKIEVVQ